MALFQSFIKVSFSLYGRQFKTNENSLNIGSLGFDSYTLSINNKNPRNFPRVFQNKK